MKYSCIGGETCFHFQQEMLAGTILTKWRVYINGWINENAIKDIAFKTLMIVPNLLLQKSSKSWKAKDYLKALEKRLGLRKQGNLN